MEYCQPETFNNFTKLVFPPIFFSFCESTAVVVHRKAVPYMGQEISTRDEIQEKIKMSQILQNSFTSCRNAKMSLPLEKLSQKEKLKMASKGLTCNTRKNWEEEVVKVVSLIRNGKKRGVCGSNKMDIQGAIFRYIAAITKLKCPRTSNLVTGNFGIFLLSGISIF